MLGTVAYMSPNRLLIAPEVRGPDGTKQSIHNQLRLPALPSVSKAAVRDLACC